MVSDLRRILLSGSIIRYAEVDDEDYIELNQFCWNPTIPNNVGTVYATTFYNGKTTGMSSLLLPYREGYLVDHIDRDGLNNRRDNLRYATHSQNMANRATMASNTSGYKGVTWRAQRNKWIAKIMLDGHSKYLGHFDNPTDAAIAYNLAAIRYHGEFAYLNKFE